MPDLDQAPTQDAMPEVFEQPEGEEKKEKKDGSDVMMEYMEQLQEFVSSSGPSADTEVDPMSAMENDSSMDSYDSEASSHNKSQPGGSQFGLDAVDSAELADVAALAI